VATVLDVGRATAPKSRDGAVRTLGLVVTYNSPANAAVCVAALNAQTLRPDAIVVVENPGSALLVADELAAASQIPVEVVRLAENVGPAGGYAEGLRIAASRTCDAIWVMDDDIAPEPDCLQRLTKTFVAMEHAAVIAPLTVDAVTGVESSTWGWCGVLFARRLVDVVGLPIAELFYGLEDLNYLRDRAQLAGFPLVREPSAVARLARRGARIGTPSWHYYYLPRNATYLYLYERGHIPRVQRLKRLLAFYLSYARTIRDNPQHRARQCVLFVHGVIDGMFRRLGRRVQPHDDRRPALPSLGTTRRDSTSSR
jgi:GT2 family glycosyltransferase